MIKKINLNELSKSTFITVLGVLFIVLMALKKLPLPGTSIQMSLQSLSISLLVITVPKKAFRIVLIYLILATLGLPVLAGGISDHFWFLSASGGYYFGFLISSYFLARILSTIKPRNFLKAWFCLSFNESVILLSGYLVLIFHIGFIKAFWVGVFPYIMGALLKITTATCYYLSKSYCMKKDNQQIQFN